MAKLLLALVAIVFFCSAEARAQTADAEPAPPTAATSGTQVTADEAARALAVLQDPGKRAELVETLQTLARAAGPKALAPTASPTPAPNPPVARLALLPDSLGAELVLEAAGWAEQFSDDMLRVSRAVANAPALWRGFNDLAADRNARALALDVSWRLIITLALAFAAEGLLALALRRPRTALEGDASPSAREPIESGPRTNYWRLLRRLPLALVRLLLLLLPIGAFAGVGLALTLAQVEAENASRLIILETLKAYILCRAVIALARTLASSGNRRLRLLRADDETAAYIEVWAQRLVVIAVGGATLAEALDLLGGGGHLRHGLVKIVVFVVVLCLVTIVLQCRATLASRLRAPTGAIGAFAAVRNRLADIWHFAAIATIVTLWFIWAARVQNGSSRLLQLAVVSAVVLAIARVIAIAALGALDRIFRINKDFAVRFPGLEARSNRYYSALRGAVSLALLWVTAIALLEVWGVDALSWFAPRAIGGQLVSALATIAIAAAAAAVFWETVNAALERHLGQLAREARFSRAARLRTLLPILRTTLMITILTVFALTALSEIGVNIAPLLAGAGIVGIAIGFGSQKLVQDLITGLFLLLENAIQVGDWVTAAGLSGAVETLSIRTMRLRAADGSVHIVPFSSVTSVTNANRGIGNAAISVVVDFTEDTDRVGEALKQIAAEMAEDPKLKSAMLSEIQLWGVDKVDGSGATIAGQIVCTDAGRWEVQREFNRRMKQRFQELGIRFAPPAPVIVLQPQVAGGAEGEAARDEPSEPDVAERPGRLRERRRGNH